VLIGYMRVSKADGSQVLDLQRDALLAAGVDAEHLYKDHASSKRDNRPGLEACLKAVHGGDTLVAWKLDRLGRDLRHLVNLVGDLTKRSVGLRVLAGEGAAIDTTTANGRLMFGFFAALAEFERELIVERTKAGLASARARGRNGGRPYKMTAAKLRLTQAAMGQPGKGGRTLHGAGHHPPDALPPCGPERCLAAGWREAARAQGEEHAARHVIVAAGIGFQDLLRHWDPPLFKVFGRVSGVAFCHGRRDGAHGAGACVAGGMDRRGVRRAP